MSKKNHGEYPTIPRKSKYNPNERRCLDCNAVMSGYNHKRYCHPCLGKIILQDAEGLKKEIKKYKPVEARPVWMKKLGRKPLFDPANTEKIRKMYKSGKHSQYDLATMFFTTPNTIGKLVKDLVKKKNIVILPYLIDKIKKEYIPCQITLDKLSVKYGISRARIWNVLHDVKNKKWRES